MEKVEFESLPLPDQVLQGIRDTGFTHCTPIQAKTLPHALEGKDVAGQAQTGTGKTAAFLIAMFTKLLRNPIEEPKPGAWVAPRALAIAPTRELAIQIERDANALGKHTGLKIVCIYGGVDYDKQREQIRKGVDVLIVTPGRLIDFYKQKFFSLKSIEVLVIDEADRMFDMGFIKDLRYILRNISPYNKRQSMLFSATLNHRVMELCYEHMNDPIPIRIEPEKLVVDKVDQKMFHVGSHEKFSLLLGLLKEEQGDKVLIFTNTKAEAENLESRLQYNDYNAAQISGDLPQKKRIKTLERFTEGELDILIATDVASRGLHIDDITHVINYDLPQDPEDYIHRIGRTARAGKRGDAISLACEEYVDNLVRIEETLTVRIPVEWPEESMFEEEKPGHPPRRKPRSFAQRRQSGDQNRGGRPPRRTGSGGSGGRGSSGSGGGGGRPPRGRKPNQRRRSGPPRSGTSSSAN
ncbi:DEAD/DEAH box helicase [Nitrospina watsonii]|uniref:ATP-dependent RNA helicase RhlB n=1 Tax=Nitrospina watsonii TaxID=1323948 RepID=A0ABN8W0I7_9BACT|nr:ATP-dependent RNA helicase RhlB [Nitrospina watsonii]